MDFIFEFEMETEKFNLECRSLWRAYEMTELKHKDMIEHANYKLMTESGTYEDAMWLYEEANAETNQNKEGILTKIRNAIRNFIQKIKNFFAGDKTQQTINGINPNQKYNGTAGPGLGSEDDIKNHHNKITQLIKDFKTAVMSKGENIPESIQNLGTNLFGTAAAGVTVAVTGNIAKSALKYAQGDAKSLDDVYNWIDNQIQKLPDKDGKNINWTKSVLEGFQELVSKESSWTNNLLGWFSSKVEGGLAKINTKGANAIRNSKEYKDLLKKQSAGTITAEEKKKLDELEDKASKKDAKADEHQANKEKSENLKELGNLESNLNRLKSSIKNTKNKLTKGTITSEAAEKERTTQQKTLDNLTKLFEDNKDDKRISESNKKGISQALDETEKAMTELKDAIGKLSNSDKQNAEGKTAEAPPESDNGNENEEENTTEKIKTDDNKSDNNDNDTEDNDSTNNDNNENEDDNKNEEDESTDKTNTIKGVTAKEYTGNDNDKVKAYKLKNGKLKNKNTEGRNVTVKQAKGLKNAVYGSGPKGDAWYYEDTEDDWFDFDINTNAVFESYSGALDDELLAIFDEI